MSAFDLVCSAILNLVCSAKFEFSLQCDFELSFQCHFEFSLQCDFEYSLQYDFNLVCSAIYFSLQCDLYILPCPFWATVILLYPAAPCLVTQRFFFKMADGKVNRRIDS